MLSEPRSKAAHVPTTNNLKCYLYKENLEGLFKNKLFKKLSLQ